MKLFYKMISNILYFFHQHFKNPGKVQQSRIFKKVEYTSPQSIIKIKYNSFQNIECHMVVVVVVEGEGIVHEFQQKLKMFGSWEFTTIFRQA